MLAVRPSVRRRRRVDVTFARPLMKHSRRTDGRRVPRDPDGRAPRTRPPAAVSVDREVFRPPQPTLQTNPATVSATVLPRYLRRDRLSFSMLKVSKRLV